jgi:hypothetical protein
VYAFINYGRSYHAMRQVELQVAGKVEKIVLLRTGEEVPFDQQGESVLAITRHFPLYDMKYSDCLKITFAE